MHDGQGTSLLLHCKTNTLPEKNGASAHEYLAECSLNQTKFLQYAINQTV